MLMRIFALLFVFLLLISSSASAIKISPTQQSLRIGLGQTNCTNIWVLPEKNYSISSRWSIDGQGDLNKYILDIEKMKLSLNHTYVSNGMYQLCFMPQRKGNFSGIILFYSEKDMVEIGTWIELDVESENVFEKISLITGNTINDKGNQTNFLLAVVAVLLSSVLYVLVKKLVFSFKNKHS